MSVVARAVAAAFGAKVNYELLGNQGHQIHRHVIPRLVTDPAPRLPVWAVEHERAPLESDELVRRLTAIRAHLPR